MVNVWFACATPYNNFTRVFSKQIKRGKLCPITHNIVLYCLLERSKSGVANENSSKFGKMYVICVQSSIGFHDKILVEA